MPKAPPRAAPTNAQRPPGPRTIYSFRAHVPAMPREMALASAGASTLVAAASASGAASDTAAARSADRPRVAVTAAPRGRPPATGRVRRPNDPPGSAAAAGPINAMAVGRGGRRGRRWHRVVGGTTAVARGKEKGILSLPTSLTASSPEVAGRHGDTVRGHASDLHQTAMGQATTPLAASNLARA